ncbi:hypothetical protein [Streptosporangium sp. CA-115845]
MELTETVRALVVKRPGPRPAVPAENVEWSDGLTYHPVALPVTSAGPGS